MQLIFDGIFILVAWGCVGIFFSVPLFLSMLGDTKTHWFVIAMLIVTGPPAWALLIYAWWHDRGIEKEEKQQLGDKSDLQQ